MTAAPTTPTALGEPDPFTGTDEQRRASLRRMRLVATGLLVLMAVVYLLTHDRAGAWGYVHAAAEAGMVGAIADWFAVTALFRHPMRLPVPHTAIIPRRKQALGRSLEQFVSTHFLTPETVRERYRTAEVARRVGRWLAVPEHAGRVVTDASPVAVTLLRRIRAEDMAGFVADTLLPRLRQEPLSPLAGHLLDAVVTDRAHHGVVDIAAGELHHWVRGHPDEVATILHARAPWWSPRWLDDQVVDRVYRELVDWTAEVASDPQHRVRLALDSYLAELAADLQRDETTMARFEALKERVLQHPQTVTAAVAVWEAVSAALQEALEDPDGRLRARLVEEVAAFGHRLESDPVLRERADELGEEAVAGAVSRYGAELATVISTTVDRWDGQEAADRIELHVGRDLQFIRINGTVVGALVGLTLHGLSQLL
ncbi:DUF445 domain-containing protein [Ornithinicoccus halotolerans]|uniref:DUF445 domain-containing protein n=1 Tax=Ornithinicoccus halotolerans TaxID=1748220 RepID=UPI001E5B0B61|nr:DUF445 domain-containing protein [Ornithinicoccus halotolerans]